MRSKALFAAVWVCLLTATVGVRQIFAGAETAKQRVDDPIAITEESINKTVLELMPRRWHPDDHTQYIDDQDVHNFVIYSRDKLYKCRDMFLSRSAMPRELFELSFYKLKAGSSFALESVKVEKSTIALTTAEEQCLVDVLQTAVNTDRPDNADVAENTDRREDVDAVSTPKQSLLSGMAQVNSSRPIYFRLCLRNPSHYSARFQQL